MQFWARWTTSTKKSWPTADKSERKFKAKSAPYNRASPRPTPSWALWRTMSIKSSRILFTSRPTLKKSILCLNKSCPSSWPTANLKSSDYTKLTRRTMPDARCLPEVEEPRFYASDILDGLGASWRAVAKDCLKWRLMWRSSVSYLKKNFNLVLGIIRI